MCIPLIPVSLLPFHPSLSHTHTEIRSHSSQQRRVLQVGSKKQRPLHVSAHLPSLPDPHTYIRTPVRPHPHYVMYNYMYM